jgi:DNA primase
MESYLDVVRAGTEECECECPFCGGSTSLQFNDVKGLWICFKCQEKGTAKELVQMLEGTYVEPDISIAQLNAELRSIGEPKSDVAKYLPDTYLARFRQPGKPSKHWIDRGFEQEACDTWELGYDFMEDRLTLPYRDPFSRHLLGIIYRTIGPVDGPRYRFPPGFSRNSSLYGSWLVGTDSRFGPADTAVIDEGPTDAIAVRQAGAQSLAQYGSSISSGQARLLHRLGIRKVILFYDYDRAGLRATEKSLHLAETFEVERAVWDRDTYCWHSKVCGCREGNGDRDVAIDHTSAGNCGYPRVCKCGRIHEPDPGSLGSKEIDKILGRTVRV